MKNLKIELLKEEDILKLRDVIEDDKMEFSKEQIEHYLSEKQNLAFVAKLDGKIIGLVYGYTLTRMDIDKPQFFIYSVGIHSDYQNRGYGSELIKYSVDYARNNNYCESFVITEKDNIRACRVMKKQVVNIVKQIAIEFMLWNIRNEI